MTIGPDGLDDIEREIRQWPRWKRWLYNSRWAFPVYAYLGAAWGCAYRAYDALVTRCRPHGWFVRELRKTGKK